MEDEEQDADFKCELSSRQNGKRAKPDTRSYSEPQNSEIESLLNVHTIDADAVGSDTDILCDIAQGYDQEEQCDKFAAILNKTARNKPWEDKLKDKLNKYLRPEKCESLVGAKVNPEIWLKVRPKRRSRDILSCSKNTIL